MLKIALFWQFHRILAASWSNSYFGDDHLEKLNVANDLPMTYQRIFIGGSKILMFSACRAAWEGIRFEKTYLLLFGSKAPEGFLIPWKIFLPEQI